MKHYIYNKWIGSFIVYIVAINISFCQDPVFSQFYHSNLQLNAAFAGTSRGPLVQLNYRNQWPALGNIYTTYALSYDQYSDRLKSGFGVSIVTDNAGDGTLKTNNLTGYYSYRIKIKNDIYIKSGIEAGITNTSLDWSKLQFGDALDPILGPLSPGGTPFPSKEAIPGDLSVNFLRVGAGILLYNPQYYLGFSLKNMNTPLMQFIGGQNSGDTSASTLPTRISLHAGSQIILRPGNKNKDATFISPNIMFQRQRDFSQLNLGAYLSVNKIHGGIWYRHTVTNGDALIASFGVKKDFFKLTYSFDLTMSSLGIEQGGSHEVGIVLNFDYLYPKKQDYNDCFAIFR